MTRTIDSNTLSQLQEPEVTVAILVSIDFDQVEGGPLYITSAPFDVDYGGNSYSGTGGLLAITEIEESAALAISKVTVSLSGVISSNVAVALGRNFRDRNMTIYLAYLDSNMAIVGDPIQIFKGPMDDVIINDTPGETVTISVMATNKFVNFDMPRGRHMSDEEQQVLFPGDAGFEFCGVQKFDYMWGVGRTAPLTPR